VSFLEILIVLLGVIYWSNAFSLRGKQTISGELRGFNGFDVDNF
jgi:hypothetical protein